MLQKRCICLLTLLLQSLLFDCLLHSAPLIPQLRGLLGIPVLVEPGYFRDQSPFSDDLSISFRCSHMQYSEAIGVLKIFRRKWSYKDCDVSESLGLRLWDCSQKWAGLQSSMLSERLSKSFPSHLEFPQSPASLKSQSQRKGNWEKKKRKGCWDLFWLVF